MILAIKYSPFSLLIMGITLANIINIPADQPTIQAGINNANDGDTVLVQPGMYVENINFNGKNVVVGSLFLTTADTAYISQSVINGNRDGSVVTFENGEDSTAAVVGFTIRNGRAQYGGGIYCNNSSPSLRYLTITDNNGYLHHGGGFGAGLALLNSNPRLIQVTIINNEAYVYGGGIYCENSNPTLVNVTVSDNICYYGGGGIYCSISSNLVAVNTILWDNMRYNTPEEIYTDSGSVANVFYSDIQGGWVGEGNLSSDPLFMDPENSDYRLQEGSPCIDAGTAFFTWEGDTLVHLNPDEYVGVAPDMGSLEYSALSIIDHTTSTPNEFRVLQNYPNPFNSITTILYQVPEMSFVNISIFNINGQRVSTLVNEQVSPGNHTVKWEAKDFSSGVYFYKLVTEKYSYTGKAIFIK
jgi:predicted outer membrane repeat protein